MEKCNCIILNYNDADTTIKLVESIKRYNTIAHIIMVDNKSTDNSVDLLQKYVSDQIHLIVNEENRGYGSGNNSGVRYSADHFEEQYCLIANPDVVFEDQLLDTMLKVFRDHSDVAIVAALQKDIDGNVIKDVAWAIPSALQYAVMSTRIGQNVSDTTYDDDYLYASEIVDVDCVPGAMLMVDAKKFLEVGGYDEEMFLFCEESTIGFKMIEAGYRTKLLTSEYYKHEHSVSINKTFSQKAKQLELIFESRRFFMKKYLNANWFVMTLAQKLQERTIRKIKRYDNENR